MDKYIWVTAGVCAGCLIGLKYYMNTKPELTSRLSNRSLIQDLGYKPIEARDSFDNSYGGKRNKTKRKKINH